MSLLEAFGEEGLDDGLDDGYIDDGDVNGEENNVVVQDDCDLQDLSEVRSASHMAGTQSAIKKFNAFLAACGNTGTRADLLALDATQLMAQKLNLGRFASFLIQRTKLSMGTSIGYLNKVRTYILKVTDDKGDVSGPKWYSRLTANLTRRYEERAALRGEKLSTQAEPMLATDVDSIVKVTLHSVWMECYVKEVFKCPLPQDEQQKGKAKKFARAIMMLRNFLPPNTEIPSKPANAELTPESYRQWHNTISRLGHIAATGAKGLCEAENRRSKPEGSRKRQRSVGDGYEGLYKRLKEVKEEAGDGGLFPAAVGLVDKVFTPELEMQVLGGV